MNIVWTKYWSNRAPGRVAPTVPLLVPPLRRTIRPCRTAACAMVPSADADHHPTAARRRSNQRLCQRRRAGCPPPCRDLAMAPPGTTRRDQPARTPSTMRRPPHLPRRYPVIDASGDNRHAQHRLHRAAFPDPTARRPPLPIDPRRSTNVEKKGVPGTHSSSTIGGLWAHSAPIRRQRSNACEADVARGTPADAAQSTHQRTSCAHPQVHLT